jgi:hypothetical protein
MIRRTTRKGMGPSRPILALALSLIACAAAPARADLIVQVGSVVAAAGSTGNGLEVTLTNTGPDAVSIDGFSFGLSVDPAVDLTGATTATASPYIFAGHSAFGPDVATSVGSSLQASDAYDPAGSAAVLASGATVGLGRVLFDVSALASGVYTVTLEGFPATSLSLGLDDVPITTLVDGSITVEAAVPEPSSAILAIVGVAALAARTARRRP